MEPGFLQGIWFLPGQRLCRCGLKQKYLWSIFQGIKVEKQIRELIFIPWLLLVADFFQGSGFAAATKEENHNRVAGAPLFV